MALHRPSHTAVQTRVNFYIYICIYIYIYIWYSRRCTLSRLRILAAGNEGFVCIHVDSYGYMLCCFICPCHLVARCHPRICQCDLLARCHRRDMRRVCVCAYVTWWQDVIDDDVDEMSSSTSMTCGRATESHWSHCSCNSHVTIPSPTESYHCHRLSNMVYEWLTPIKNIVNGFRF